MTDRPLSAIVTAPPTDPDWLIPDLIHRGTMTILAGEAGIGKSSLALSLAVSLVYGLPFLDRECPISRVLYFDEENSTADGDEYLRWAWYGLGAPTPATELDHRLSIYRFRLAGSPDPFDFMTSAATEQTPDLIILDTATPCCRIKDENDNAEATRAISQLRVIRAVASATTAMLILKHAKTEREEGQYSIRGAKAWLNATDATIYHLPTPGRPRRDGLRASRLEPGKVRAFGLRSSLKISPSWSWHSGHKGLVLELG